MASPVDAREARPETLERVLEVVRGLAREVGGHRAAGAVSPGASLERDVGLGSLERVELLSRIEKALGRTLDDGCLSLDSAEELALAADGEAPRHGAPQAEAGPALGAARRLAQPVSTVHESLWRRAEVEPDRPHVHLREDDGREHTVGYGQLLDEARAVAGGLRARGVSRGETVALMLPTGLDFLRAFQGILIAGAIPVPIYPPVRLDRIEEYALRQSAILADAGVVALVTIPRARPVAGLLRKGRVPSLAHVLTPEELVAAGERFPSLQGEGADAAFIQYTSGSTGQPKGVLLSHANLLANIRAIGRGLEVRPTDVGVSWLPLYHDMGLIGSWLFCLHEGLPLDLQSPLSFLSRPERWLWAIHRRRATLSAAPNFAYELCVRKVPDESLEGLDLSSWRCALNGAEPVNPDTLERFVKRFGPHGFRREALTPVYGLAECSVALCFPPVGRGPRVDRVERAAFEARGEARRARDDDASALRFVSVGTALPGHELRVVDAEGRPVAERVVGRLAFRGPSTTAGYFGKPEATAAIRLEDGLLDSGDLAYVADGETYIAGRLKDLIIAAGRNLVPQEIEEAASTVPGVRKGCVVAVGVPQEALGTEGLVVVAETRETEAAARDRIASAVTERVAEAVGVPPERVVLVPPGAVPKTSSGKIRRADTRKLLVAGSLGRPARASFARRARLLTMLALHELRLRLGAFGRLLYGAYLLLLLVPGALLAWLVVALVPTRRLSRALEHAFCRATLRAAGFSVETLGLELVSREGPLILACNHASYADIPVLLAAVPRRFAFVAKREVRDWPLVGAFVRRSGHVTVERWETAQSAADSDQIRAAIQDGDCVLVFPEGTFTAAAGLRPFRLGAFKAAVETGTPIVPLALKGTRGVLRDGAWIPRPQRVRLWIGPPVRPSGSDWPSVVEMRDRVAGQIAAECGEPRLDLVAGAPPRPAP